MNPIKHKTDYSRQLRDLQREQRQHIAMRMVVAGKREREANLDSQTGRLGEIALLQAQSATEAPQTTPAQPPVIEQTTQPLVVHKV